MSIELKCDNLMNNISTRQMRFFFLREQIQTEDTLDKSITGWNIETKETVVGEYPRVHRDHAQIQTIKVEWA